MAGDLKLFEAAEALAAALEGSLSNQTPEVRRALAEFRATGKRCPDCRQVKPLSEFNLDRSSGDGRQRRCKVCHRASSSRDVKKHYDKRRTTRERYRQEHAEQESAAREVQRALKRGELHRPAACQNCQREGKVEAHHYDYKRPLDVRWLCRSCHRKEHPVEERL